MYREDYFYGLSDVMHFNLYDSLLKDKLVKEERGIIKVFKRNEEILIIETVNNRDEIIKDTRINKNEDITSFDLTFLKVIERYICDYEIPNMIYEYIEGIGSWYRVKIDGYLPSDKRLKPFYFKKKIEKKDLNKYVDNKDDLKYLEKFYDIKGLVKFNKVKDVIDFFKQIED